MHHHEKRLLKRIGYFPDLVLEQPETFFFLLREPQRPVNGTAYLNDLLGTNMA